MHGGAWRSLTYRFDDAEMYGRAIAMQQKPRAKHSAQVTMTPMWDAQSGKVVDAATAAPGPVVPPGHRERYAAARASVGS